MGKVLALDLGLTTGWSIAGKSGEQAFHARGRTPLERDRTAAVQFARWLSDLLWAEQPDVVVLEGVYLSAAHPAAARVLYGLRMVALSVVADAEFREVPASEWQQWAKQQGWAKGDGPGSHVNDARYLRLYYEAS